MCSSDLGQIMPPVMGAAAFIMAQTMGISYVEVALAAVVPALLYYIAVIVQVHYEATRLGLKGLPRDRLPRLWTLLWERGHLLIPLAGIIYFLVCRLHAPSGGLSGNHPDARHLLFPP